MSSPTRLCRTCRSPFKPAGKARYCSPACRCGTDAGYNAGCRCARCRAAHARNHKKLRLRPRPLVDATGTHRRVKALARLGWSTAELSRRLGKTRSYLAKTMDRDRVDQDTAAAVARLYDQLSMTWCTDTTAARTAATARASGWAPPLAWDEGAIDDPAATPAGRLPSTGHVDEVTVARILAGEYHLPATRAERIEVGRRWVAAGRSRAELGRLTGWNPQRYCPPDHQIAA